MKTESVCWIPLTKGHWAQVDLVDASRVLELQWHVHDQKKGVLGTSYAVCTITKPGGRETLQLQRFILGAGPGEIVDHKNRDGLDNRRSNLRFANRSQNQANSGKRTGGNKFKGVRRVGRWWVAKIGADKRKIHLGSFESEEAAARAYDQAAKKLFGEFARPNFPA